MTPFPKRVLDPPHKVRVPPPSGVVALFFLYKNPRLSRPEALLEVVLWYVFLPPYIFAPPHIMAWWTFRIFFFFLSARGGGRGSPRRQEGGGSVFY